MFPGRYIKQTKNSKVNHSVNIPINICFVKICFAFSSSLNKKATVAKKQKHSKKANSSTQIQTEEILPANNVLLVHVDDFNNEKKTKDG